MKVAQGDTVASNIEEAWSWPGKPTNAAPTQNVMREKEEEIPLLVAFSLLGLTWPIPLSTHSFHFRAVGQLGTPVQPPLGWQAAVTFLVSFLFW